MSYKDEQKRTREALKPKLMAGYKFNAMPNRAKRRAVGHKLPSTNVQTYVKPAVES